MQRALSSLLGLTLAASLPGCGETEDDPAGSQPPGEQAASELPRNTSPEASDADRAALAAGHHAFAWDMFDAIGERENLVLSPLSIQTALVMTYAGARGDTAAQMAAALRLGVPDERLHEVHNWLDLELETRNDVELRDDETESPVTFRLVNRLWAQRDYTFVPAFLDLLAVHYGAGVSLMDFVQAPEAAREAINAWVEEQTADRIQDLLPQGSIRSDTRLVLTNALYLKAAWDQPFNADLTADASFQVSDAETVTVSMMRGEGNYAYAEGETYQAVELPFRGQELAMVLLLPAPAAASEFSPAAAWADALAALAPAYGRVALPRFEVRAPVNLVQPFQDLGMVDAFDGNADFSGMNGSRDLVITDIVHQTFIAVDESGAEAAAATAVVVGETSVPEIVFDYTFDRPFYFMIRDRTTNVPLFVGRIDRP